MNGDEVRFALAGYLKPCDGYGYGTIKIGEALRRMTGGAVELVSLEKVRRFEVPVVVVCTPDWLPEIEAPRVIAHTMFEATRLPVGWVEKLNDYSDTVVVPCAWNAEVFVENGVLRPVRVARWGIDPEDYFPLDRADHDGPYTFLWSGTPDQRKGWDVAYRAFRQAFGDRHDVRLVLHFRTLPTGVTGCDDANVEIVEGLFGRPRLREMLQAADCYVFPSRGEGWGLPPREAAATGLPAIATDFGGLAEEIEDWGIGLPIAGMSRAEYGFWTCDLGHWAEPDQQRLQELMVWCVEDRAGAAGRGARAAAWLAEHGTWERTAREILDVAATVVDLELMRDEEDER